VVVMGRRQTLCWSHLREEILVCEILRIEAWLKQETVGLFFHIDFGWTQIFVQILDIHVLKAGVPTQ
jgi:hypothetical protein